MDVTMFTIPGKANKGMDLGLAVGSPFASRGACSISPEQESSGLWIACKSRRYVESVTSVWRKAPRDGFVGRIPESAGRIRISIPEFVKTFKYTN
jgi:hypothetical protein